MDDARWMRGALTLARRSLGRTWPNPAVGCVIVRDGRVLARGTTAPGGRPHAETIALCQAKNAAGATAYVTLEPCAHHGKTPPCTEALIGAGITRVVCPIPDPDPRVSGRGFAALEEAGIVVTQGLLVDEARDVNAGFLSRIQRGRPWITLKVATTLDGRIATRTGESRWITAAPARRRVHLMRAQSDAILIGAGTARVDNPMLDVRGIGLTGTAPVRIVADPGLSLPLTGRLVSTAGDQPLWILHRPDIDQERERALRDLGATLIGVPALDGTLDMTACMRRLGDLGITRLMVEGGGRLAASLVSVGLIDEIAHFSAGRIIGADGIPVVQAFGLQALDNAPNYALRSTEIIGPDVLTWWSRTD